MKRLLALAAAAAMLSVAAPAVAQDSDRLIPVRAAPQDAEREAKEALVRRFFVAAQLDKLTNGMMEQMLPSMMANSAIPEDKRALVNEAFMEAFAEVTPQMNEAMIDIYADAFTREELEQLVAFYESPVGRSLTAKSVMLTRELGGLMERFQPIMQQAMIRELCERIDCSAQAVAPTAKR